MRTQEINLYVKKDESVTKNYSERVFDCPGPNNQLKLDTNSHLNQYRGGD